MAKKSKKTAVKKTSTKSAVKLKAKAKPAAAKSKSKPVRATAKKTVGTPKATVASAWKITAGSTDPRVIEYKLFTEDSVRNLEDQVNYHIKKGWAPVGGVVLHGQNTFTQTMVRHEH